MSANPTRRYKGLASRLAHWSTTHWKSATAVWLTFVAASFLIGNAIGTRQINQSQANVGESHTADQIIDRGHFKNEQDDAKSAKPREMVLIQSATLTASDPAFRAVTADAVRTLRTFPKATELAAPLVSPDRHAVLIRFTPAGSRDEVNGYIDSITSAVDKVEARHAGFYVASVGVSTEKAIDEAVQGGLGLAGLVSIPLTIAILLLVTGSLVAALIPLLLGLTSVLATGGLLAISSRGIPASKDIMEVVLLVGLAVGVDYALFYMRREREERAAGRTERAALEAAAATSGRAVLVSGMTVLIAMAGMFLSGDKTFMSFSVGTMIVVAVAMLGSLTVVPAVLGKLGDRVERGRIPFTKRPSERRRGRAWGGIVDRVLRRPVLFGTIALGALLTLAIPTLSLHTTQTGMEGITTPAIEPIKKLVKAFPGSPVPAIVAVEAKDVTTPAVQKAIVQLEHEALATGEVSAPVRVEVDQTKRVARIELPLAGNGVDDKSAHALTTLREKVLPKTLGPVTGVEYAVTGITANSYDFNDALRSSAPRVFAFVLLFALLLMLVSFRSLVIAAKAIVLNLLSVAAAYGVVVAVFQWGWGESLLSFQSNGGIANWLPVFMFVILFGLSMDYHVFMLSRVREAHDRGMSTDEAVAHGIKSTAGVVTSAATVMIGVFSVFTLLPLVDLKEMGIGLAVAVLIDATIVRGLLLPASMKLLGNANWYLPKWLRWLPHFEHGEQALAPAPMPEAPAARELQPVG